LARRYFEGNRFIKTGAAGSCGRNWKLRRLMRSMNGPRKFGMPLSCRIKFERELVDN
jgi:hypothetical protein